MYVFIGGTPAAGKSYMAKKFAEDSGLDITVVSIDDLREEWGKDPHLAKWVNIFSDKDENEYWKTADFEQHSQLLIQQSEAFFPKILEKVEQVKSQEENALFEGVNLLPHLVYKHFGIPGFFLVNQNFNTVLTRLETAPRWGRSRDLQAMEARYFIEYDARFIREQSEKYGFKTFSDSSKAEAELRRLFSLT